MPGGFGGGVQLSGPGMVPRFMRNRRLRGDIVLKRRRRVPTNRALAKKVKKLQFDEPLNWKDVDIDENPSTSWIVTNLLPDSHGDGTGQFEGDAINVTSVQMNLRFTSASNSESFNQIRVIVFWDRQPNESFPTMSGSLDAVLDSLVINYPITAPYNHHTISRFKILYDRVINLNPQAQAASVVNTMVPVVRSARFKKKTHRRVMYGTLPDIPITNGLFIAMISNTASALPGVSGGTRVYYKP